MTLMCAHSGVLKATANRHARSQKGYAIIEFALILPIFVALVFGMISISLALYDKTILTMAAREGARAASVASTDHVNVAQTAGNAACSGKLISAGAAPSSPVTATISGGNVTVTASMAYVTFGYFEWLYPPNFPISATVTMRLETP